MVETPDLPSSHAERGADRGDQSRSASRGSYGSPRVTAALRRSRARISRHRVARLMRGAELRGKSHRKPRVSTTNSKHGEPRNVNLLERDFTANEPNQKWLSNITYLPTSEGWLYQRIHGSLYLAVVLDVFSRRVVSWAFSLSLQSSLVVNAFDMACQSRKPSDGLVFHSDQGVQRPRSYGACLRVKTVCQRLIQDYALETRSGAKYV